MISPARSWREFPQRYRLEAAKCTGCGKVLYPPRVKCPACGGTAFEAIVLPREGKVAFSEYPKGGFLGVAMRTDRYRYVEWTDNDGNLAACELYDHQADPREDENIAGDPQYGPLMAGLSRQISPSRFPASHGSVSSSISSAAFAPSA